jgi:hypothetical protein
MGWLLASSSIVSFFSANVFFKSSLFILIIVCITFFTFKAFSILGSSCSWWYDRWLWMAMHLWSMSKKTYYRNNQSRLILWMITTSTRQIGLPDVLVERRNHRQECSRYYWCLTKDHSTTLPVHARCLQHQATEHPTRLRRTRSSCADRRKSI